MDESRRAPLLPWAGHTGQQEGWRIFTSAQGDDWAASAIHPDHGEITLRNLLELYADHSERHVEQILVCRRLLRSPLEMESLLPRRLY